MTLYWHGGRPGIRPGGILRPPSETKVPSLSEYGAAGVHRRDRVYLTTRLEAALLYACVWPKGVIYLCAPIGEIEPDPDCTQPGLSWQCARARVLSVLKPSAADLAAARQALRP